MVRWGVLVLVPAIAVAQPAAALFDEGRKLLAAGKPAEACAKFEAALRQEPEAAGVLLNLGLCNEQQGKIASALKWFRKAQTRGAESGLAEVEAVARQQTRALSSQVPTIEITAPAGASVTIDGATIDPTSLSKLEIDAGHHVAEVDGFAQPFDVAADPSHTQAIVLHREPPAPPYRAPWVVGGIGAGLVVASGAIGLVGKIEYDGTQSVATKEHWKHVVEYGGTATFAAGCVALATATVLYLRHHADDTTVAPTAAPGQLGFAVSGAF
jgi:hypothetical protein